ncbi:MAG: cysteine desulfurase family protein [Blastocatellia bacterium]
MIYLDNNATTKIAPEVFGAMLPFLEEEFGNPSSTHAAGHRARGVIESARESVAELIGAASADEIVFTSGGTESDNWAILGTLAALPDKDHVITTRVEHEAVRKLCAQLEHQKKCRVTWLNVDEEGGLDLDQLRDSLDDSTAVVSVMLANNETGILFPIGEVAAIVEKHSNVLLHVDGVNAAGKIPIDVRDLGVDLFSLSAHKFHGPKGIGALYIRGGLKLPPYIIGGGQESGRRAGTEAVHQIAGIGAAARFASDLSVMDRIKDLRDRLENSILQTIPNAFVNGTSDPAKRLPNTTNISFENTNGEAILARLDDLGICVSTGSACNSDNHTASPVLQSMNVPYSKAMGSIRFSLGRFITHEDIGFVLLNLPKIISHLRPISW